MESVLGRYQTIYGMVCIGISRQSQTKSEPEGSRPTYHTIRTSPESHNRGYVLLVVTTTYAAGILHLIIMQMFSESF